MLLCESPGTIILPTNERASYTLFYMSLGATQQPNDTILGVRASAGVTENINSAIKDLREEDRWIWILGDDHVWQPDCLMDLLRIMDANEEVDILVPLVTKRSPPWHIVIFHHDGQYEDGITKWKHFNSDEIPEHGLFEVDAAGSAGMLIRREVLDEMEYPWFESSNGHYLNEDVNFCEKAKDEGFTIFATSDVVMGHIGIFNVRPFFRNGEWGAMTEYSSPEERFKSLFMPVEDHA